MSKGLDLTPVQDEEVVYVGNPQAMAKTKDYEGFRSTIYRDTRGKRTVGYGFNVDDPSVANVLPTEVSSGQRPITRDEANSAFDTLYQRAQKDAADVVGQDTYLNMPGQVQDVVNDMSYNMGRSKLAGFKKAVGALQEGDYAKFGDEIKDSNWFSQVGRRSRDHLATVDGLVKKNTLGDVLSALNPLGATDANADEVPAKFDGLDLTPAEAPAAAPKLDLTPVGSLPPKVGTGLDLTPIADNAAPKADTLHDLLSEDASTALRPMSPENVQSIKAGLLGAGEIALSRTDLYKDPEVKQLLQDHPIAKGVGETVRDLALLVPIGRALEGVAALPFIPQAAQAVAKAAEGTALGKRFLNAFEVQRYVAKAVHSGATFGTLAALKQAGIEQPDQNALSVAQHIATDTIWGAGLGIATAAPTFMARVATAGTYGGVTTALNGGSPLDIALNTALFGGFELLGGKDIDRNIKLQAMQNMRRATSEYLVKGGMAPDEAVRMADTAFNNSIKAAGGLDNVIDNNSAPFMNELASEMKKANPTWGMARPKTLSDGSEFDMPKPGGPSSDVNPYTPGGNVIEHMDDQGKVSYEAVNGRGQSYGIFASAEEAKKIADENIKKEDASYFITPDDKNDIKNLVDWESHMPNGETLYNPQAGEGEQFSGVTSGHSDAMQDVGPKASFDLLKKAMAGEQLTDKQQEKVKGLLEDYRTNIKPHLDATLQEIEDAKGQLTESEAAETFGAFKEEAGAHQYDWEGNIVPSGNAPEVQHTEKNVESQVIPESVNQKKVIQAKQIVRLGGMGPRTYEVIEEMPREEGDLPGERFFKVKDVKTGEEGTVEAQQIKSISKDISKISSKVDQPKLDLQPVEESANSKEIGWDEVVPDDAMKILNNRFATYSGVKIPKELSNKGITLKKLIGGFEQLGGGEEIIKESTIALREAGYKKIGNILLTEDGAKSESVESPKNLGGGQANIGIRSIDQYEPAQNTPSKQAAFKLSDRVVELVKKYAVRFGEDYNPSGSEGVFYPQTDNIFVKAKNDVGVAAHEVTHYLDKKIGFTKSVMVVKGRAKNGNPIYDPATKGIRKELTDIYTRYYPGAKKDHPLKNRVQEGIAVFFERMVTHPAQTMKEYPGIYKDFLLPGGRYFEASMPQFVREARAIINDYQKLSDLEKIGARVVDSEVMDEKPFLNIQEKAIFHNIDNKYPLEKLAKEAGAHFTKGDPSLIARIYDHVPMLIQHNLSDAAFVGLGSIGFGKETYVTMKADGEIARKYDFNWHTLVNKVGTNLDDFNNWLVARRVVANYKRVDDTKQIFLNKAKELEAAKASGIEPTDMRELIEEAKQARADYAEAMAVVRNDRFDKGVATRAYNEHKDRFKENAKMFDDLVKADIELARNADMISMKKFDEMSQEEGYATFKRQIENELIGTGEGVNAPRSVRVGKNKVSSLFRYGGSGKDIVSPVYSSMENHQEIMKKASRQMVYNGVAKIADKFPDLFQKVPLSMHREDSGRVTYPQDKDPNIMMAYADGRRVPYAVNKDLKTMMDAMLTPTTVGLTEKIFTGLAQAFTKGTTAFYYPFAATNFVIDQLSAASNSWTKFVPIYTPISELVKALSNRESVDAKYAMEYFMLGGERQAYLSFADLNPKEAYEFLKDEQSALKHFKDALEAGNDVGDIFKSAGKGIKVGWEKGVEILNKGGDILATPVKATELMTRMSEFIRARKAGYSQLAALELAGRISTPFHHRGQKGDIYRFLTRSIPYLNASIQVLAQEARTIKHPKTRGRALFIMAAISAAMVAGVVSILNSSEEQKRLLKGLSVDRLARFVFFPSPDGQSLIKLRVPQEMAAFATVLNMAIIDASLNAKYSALEYLRGATGWLPDQLNPTDIGRMIASWFPQAVSPAVQVAFNKRIYPSIRDLEPDYMKYLPKNERVFENSSNVSKWFGPALGLSPIQFDALVEGYTGRSLRYVTGREVGNPFEEKVYLTASRQLIAFYAERQKNDEAYQQLKDDPKRFSQDEAAGIRSKHYAIDQTEKLLKEYRKVTKENKNDPKLLDLRTKILDKIDAL